MALGKLIMCLAMVVCASTALVGCDMRHAVRIQPIDAKGDSGVSRDQTDKKDFSLEAIVKTINPVIEKYKMECATAVKAYGREISCRTSPISTTKLALIEKEGSTKVLVEDDSPIFFWTPQPFGGIRKDIEKVLIDAYGVRNLSCGEGFGLVIPCEGWPQ